LSYGAGHFQVRLTIPDRGYISPLKATIYWPTIECELNCQPPSPYLNVGTKTISKFTNEIVDNADNDVMNPDKDKEMSTGIQ